MIKREINESPIQQGADERIAYLLTTTPWGSSPSAPEVKLYSVNITTGAYTDVSTTNLTGTASATGDVITTPLVIGLSEGTRYRIEIKFVSGGNTFEAFGWIEGTR